MAKAEKMVVATGLFALMTISITYAATGENLVTRVDQVTVRDAPNAKAPVIMVLERGHKLKELRRSGSWIKAIIYGTTGQDGWVLKSEVTPIPPKKETIGESPDRSVGNTKSPKQTDNPRFVLTISGVQQPFRVRCIMVHDGSAKRRITLKGNHPQSYGLDAKAVDCRVDRIDQHAGLLRAELYGKKSSIPLGTNSTYEAFGCIHVRSDGPWGKAYGRRCSRVTRF